MASNTDLASAVGESCMHEDVIPESARRISNKGVIQSRPGVASRNKRMRIRERTRKNGQAARQAFFSPRKEARVYPRGCYATGLNTTVWVRLEDSFCEARLEEEL